MLDGISARCDIDGMKTHFQIGQVVRLRSSQGIISRVVVEDHGEIISVCKEEELDAAKREYRQPLTVGFKKGDFLGLD